MNVKVEDVMSESLIVGYVPGTIRDALSILAKHNVSGMPILKKETKQVVGVLTRSDIFKNPDEDQLALIMSEDIHFVEKDQDIEDAAKLLFENRIHGLPVINNRKNLVGIISPTDILKVLPDKSEEIIENYFTNIVVPVHQDTPINIIMKIMNITHKNALPILNDERKLVGIVTEITDVIKAFKNTPVNDVAESLVNNHVSHMPIVDASDRLIGMVTDIDLMACML